MAMWVNEAVDLLSKYGSSNDPIFYRGRETTPENLSYEIDWTRLARHVSIKFYGIQGDSKELTLISGTLADMVHERATTIRDRG